MQFLAGSIYIKKPSYKNVSMVISQKIILLNHHSEIISITDEIYDIPNFLTWRMFEDNITICQILSQSSIPFQSYRASQTRTDINVTTADMLRSLLLLREAICHYRLSFKWNLIFNIFSIFHIFYNVHIFISSLHTRRMDIGHT